MPVDLQEYYDENKGWFGPNPKMSDLAKSYYDLHNGSSQMPFDDWAKAAGVQPALDQEKYNQQVQQAKDSNPGILSEFGRSLGRGIMEELPQTVGKGLQWNPVDPSQSGNSWLNQAGQSLEKWGKENVQKYPGLTQSKAADEAGWYNPRSWAAGSGGLLTMAAAPVVAGAAASLIPGVGVVAGPAAAAAVTYNMFGAATAEDAYRNAKEQGLPDSQAFPLATGQGIVMGTAGHFLTKVIPEGVFNSLGGEVKNAILNGIVAKGAPKQIVGNVLKTVLEGQAVGAGQVAASHALNYGYGVDQAGNNTGEDILHGVGPMLVLSAVTGMGGIIGSESRKADIRKSFEDPTKDPHKTTGYVNVVANAADRIEPGLGDMFKSQAMESLKAGKPIVLNDDYYRKLPSMQQEAPAQQEAPPQTQPQPPVSQDPIRATLGVTDDQTPEDVLFGRIPSTAEQAAQVLQYAPTTPAMDSAEVFENAMAQDDQHASNLRTAWDMVDNGIEKQNNLDRFQQYQTGAPPSAQQSAETLRNAPATPAMDSADVLAEGINSGNINSSFFPGLNDGSPIDTEIKPKDISDMSKNDLTTARKHFEDLGRTDIVSAIDGEVANKNNQIPLDLRTAIDFMRGDISTPGIQAVGVDPDTGRGFGHASSYPQWFRDLNKDVATNVDNVNGMSRNDFLNITDKLQRGEPLTDRQESIWDKMRQAAEKFKGADGDMLIAQDADDIQKEGFEPTIGGDNRIVAAEFKEGDKLLFGDETFEMKGYDKDGNIVFKDGETRRVDPFDHLTPDGVRLASADRQVQMAKGIGNGLRVQLDKPEEAGRIKSVPLSDTWKREEVILNAKEENSATSDTDKGKNVAATVEETNRQETPAENATSEAGSSGNILTKTPGNEVSPEAGKPQDGWDSKKDISLNETPKSSPGMGGVKAEDVIEELKPLIDQIKKSGVKFDILNNPSEMEPGYLKDYIGQHESGGTKLVKGFYHSKMDVMHIFTDRMTDMDDVQRTIAHELIGHKGLYDFMGEHLNDFLDYVTGHRDYKDQILETGQRRGLDLNTEFGIHQAAKEWFAELVAKGDVEPNLWSRFVVAVRNALRSMGFTAKFDDKDIAEIIRGSRNAAEGKYGGQVSYSHFRRMVRDAVSNGGMDFSTESVKPWPEDFPNIISHSNQAKLSGHQDHEAAKGGDTEAAIRVVRDLFKPKKAIELAEKYPDAMLVPVRSVETSGDNKLPLALAHAISDATGLPIDASIYQTNHIGHTESNRLQRLLSRATFGGKVIPGQKYILCEDTAASGGTLHELRHYIENNGGEVVAATTLGFGRGATVLAIKPETIAKIERKFGREQSEAFLREHNIAGNLKALTEGEGKYLGSQPSLDAFRAKIAEGRPREGGEDVGGTVQRPEALTPTVSSDTSSAATETQPSPAKSAAPLIIPDEGSPLSLNKGTHFTSTDGTNRADFEAMPDKKNIVIHDVWTDPEDRGNGVATGLVKNILDKYPKESIWLGATSPGMEKVAEKLGFDLYRPKGVSLKGTEVPASVDYSNASVWVKRGENFQSAGFDFSEIPKETFDKISEENKENPPRDYDDLLRQSKKIIYSTLRSAKNIMDGIKAVGLPTALSPEHLKAAEMVGARLGEMYRSTKTSLEALKTARKVFDRMGVFGKNLSLEDNPGMKFASDMSTGKAVDPKFKDAENIVSNEFKSRLEQLADAGAELRTVRENYFPGMWQKDSIYAFNKAMSEFVDDRFGKKLSKDELEEMSPEDIADYKSRMAAKDEFGIGQVTPEERAGIKARVEDLLKNGDGIADDKGLQYFTKRPLKGGESFRKEKVFGDIMDAIKFGLKPISQNPVDLVGAKLAEMDRSIMANRVLRDAEASGDKKFLPIDSPVPQGWEKINDKFGTVYGDRDIKLSEYVDRNVYDGLMKVADNMGLHAERALSAGRGKLGYASRSGDVVSQFGTELSVLAHEIGHQIDYKYGLWDKIVDGAVGYGAKGEVTKTATAQQRSQIKDELRGLADLTWEGSNPSSTFKRYVRKKNEQMAHMLEAYIHAPEKFKEVAPTVYKSFDSFIKNIPELSELSKIKQGLSLKQLDNKMTMGGLPIVGYHILKSPAADILNSYLSQPLYNNKYFGELYRNYMAVSNALNQAQLGIGSAFHAGFTTIETLFSGMANNLKDIYGLATGTRTMDDVMSGMMHTLKAPTENPKIGGEILKAYSNPGTGDEHAQMVARAVEIAGGRVDMDSALRTHRADKMLRDYYGGNKVAAAARSPLAFIEMTAAPIMNWLVPRQKLGVFSELVDRIVADNPGRRLEDLKPELRQAWNRVDARLGQVVYDRLFINNTAKNMIQAIVRAPGWSGGTIAEIGGSLGDTVKFFRQWHDTGKAPKNIPDRVAYTASMLVGAAVINGALTKLLSGDDPKGMDYWAFRTGDKDMHGRPERYMLPAYTKDVLAYGTRPGETLLAKTHPILNLIGSMLHNKDYYGNKIRNEDDGPISQAGDLAYYGIKQFVPFWMRGVQQQSERGESMGRMILPLIGVMPAPSAMNKTRAETLMSDYMMQKLPIGGRTKDQAAKHDLVIKVAHEFMVNPKAGYKAAQDAVAAGKLMPKDIKTIAKNATTPATVGAFKKISAEEAIKVWDVATDDEKTTFRPFMAQKLRSAQNIPAERRAVVVDQIKKAISQPHN